MGSTPARSRRTTFPASTSASRFPPLFLPGPSRHSVRLRPKCERAPEAERGGSKDTEGRTPRRVGPRGYWPTRARFGTLEPARVGSRRALRGVAGVVGSNRSIFGGVSSSLPLLKSHSHKFNDADRIKMLAVRRHSEQHPLAPCCSPDTSPSRYAAPRGRSSPPREAPIRASPRSCPDATTAASPDASPSPSGPLATRRRRSPSVGSRAARPYPTPPGASLRVAAVTGGRVAARWEPVRGHSSVTPSPPASSAEVPSPLP